MENEKQKNTCVVCGRECAGDLLAENTKGEMVPVCDYCYHSACFEVYSDCKLNNLKVTPAQFRLSANKYGCVLPFSFLQKCEKVKDDFDGQDIPVLIAKKYTFCNSNEVKQITTNLRKVYNRFYVLTCEKCNKECLFESARVRDQYTNLFVDGKFFCPDCAQKLKVVTDFATGKKTANFVTFENHKISKSFIDDFTNLEYWTTLASYGSHPAFLPLTNCKKITSFAGFGIELETESDEYECDRFALMRALYREFGEFFYGQKDGSLDSTGIEITTRPFDYANFLKIDWQKFSDILKKKQRKSGIDEDASDCGMHIHASRLLFGKNQKQQNYNIAKVLLFFKKNEAALWRFAKRTSNHYARSISCNANFDSAKNLANNQYMQDSRYYAINLGNEDTVEFRLFDGTTNADLITARIEFLYLLITNIKKYRYESDFLSVKNLFKGASDNLKKQLLDCGLIEEGDI